MSCKRCGSWAINHEHHGRDGSEPNLCDVCYWRNRTEAKDAELAGYVEANRHMKGELDDALEDARKYCEAQGEIARLTDANRHQDEMIGEQATQIARLREAMAIIAHPVNIGKLYHMDAVTQARAALAQVAESPE